MDIKIGNYNVVSSGSIVSIEKEPIEFVFNEYGGFIVRLNFVEDIHNLDTQSARVDIYGKDGIQFFFTNYKNSLGTGNAEPLRLASINNNTLDFFINYRIYSLSQGGKHVHYTFLTLKK